jgi:hypothetical protein
MGIQPMLAQRSGRLPRRFAILIAAVVCGTTPSLAEPNAFETFRNALADYFAKLDYVPVLVNRGYTDGDVVEVDGVNFYARALRCFPRLKPPEPVHSALMDVFETTKAGLNFGLMLKRIFDSSAGADLVRCFRNTAPMEVRPRHRFCNARCGRLADD